MAPKKPYHSEYLSPEEAILVQFLTVNHIQGAFSVIAGWKECGPEFHVSSLVATAS